MEIERKFLIDESAIDLTKYDSRLIEQGYLNQHPAIRVRRDNEKYYMTYKNTVGDADVSNMVRIEHNLPLTAESYANMIKKCDGRIITKRRYLVPLDNDLTAEVDVFMNDLEGLVFAEVEFETYEDAKAFKAPSWFIKDVTDDIRYQNSYIAYH